MGDLPNWLKGTLFVYCLVGAMVGFAFMLAAIGQATHDLVAGAIFAAVVGPAIPIALWRLERD